MVRSLGRRGIDTVCASADETVPEFASKYCAERVTVPAPTDDFPAYRDALLDLAGREDVATVIPCREEDAYLLSKYRSEFEAHVSLVVPTLDALEVVHDRRRLFDAAAEAGVPIPETQLLSEVDAWDSPRLIKSRYNLVTDAYLDSHPSAEPTEVNRIDHVAPGDPPDAEEVRAAMGHDPIVQEFVPNDGKYMFAALYNHGDPLSTFQHEQIRGNSYIGGGGVYRRSTDIEALERVARKLLGRLEWHGLACIEYIRDARTGEFKLLEINPRMWQSLPSTVYAGADFPYHYWLTASGHAERIDPDYELGVGTHMLYGEAKYLLSLLRDDSPNVEKPAIYSELGSVVASCLTEPHFDFFSLDDPRPFLQGFRKFVSSE
ncbi:carboxylate--amine ligase [Halobellus sp. Atlit-31R]|nr:carboxylate--amine ligase [Halobellus sp. Atlit-31R]